jgi:hypothetical protein
MKIIAKNIGFKNDWNMMVAAIEYTSALNRGP